MPSSTIVAVIGLTAAALFSALGRQFTNYGEGKKSYLQFLEGRYFTAAILIALLSGAGSAAITFLRGGSSSTFFWVFGGFLLWEAVLFVVLIVRSRR